MGASVQRLRGVAARNCRRNRGGEGEAGSGQDGRAFYAGTRYTGVVQRLHNFSPGGPIRPYPGFTLVELLVVITIIAILLALMMPAMDKAIYQAELAVCASNQRQTATGLYVYAMDHRRWYP